MAQPTELNRYMRIVRKQLIYKYNYPKHANLPITDLDRLSFLLGVHPKDRAEQIAEDVAYRRSAVTGQQVERVT